jgi:threonyl-tRNA synthetase
MHDHRKLGRELGLFGTDPLIGAGLPYWLPAGAAVRHALEEYLRELERRAGYQHVYSPVLGKRELYEMSGHWSHYRDGMYPPMELDPVEPGPVEPGPVEPGPTKPGPMKLGREEVVLRPSLCPHHALLYRSRGRSYRELPLRLAELGGQFRAELSGVLGGLTRVRAMQLNDAHIFCTPDQAADEARAALAMIREAYAALGIEPARYRLSLRGPGGKYVGDPRIWDRAAAMLAGILDDSGLDWEPGEGEAAFYGPKIDVQVADASEREATLSTVQVDFYQPDRFGLHYTGPDGARHRPVMVHRSIVGSMERAVAHLIERHGGAFPDWLAPEQLVVLPVADAQDPAAAAVARRATGLGLRARVASPDSGTLNRRIRSSRLVPYQAVIGEREAAGGQVAVRLRDGRRLPPLPADAALAGIAAHAAAHRTDLWAAGGPP